MPNMLDLIIMIIIGVVLFFAAILMLWDLINTYRIQKKKAKQEKENRKKELAFKQEIQREIQLKNELKQEWKREQNERLFGDEQHK